MNLNSIEHVLEHPWSDFVEDGSLELCEPVLSIRKRGSNDGPFQHMLGDRANTPLRHWLDANQDLRNDIEAPSGGHPGPGAYPEPNLSLSTQVFKQVFIKVFMDYGSFLDRENFFDFTFKQCLANAAT